MSSLSIAPKKYPTRTEEGWWATPLCKAEWNGSGRTGARSQPLGTYDATTYVISPNFVFYPGNGAGTSTPSPCGAAGPGGTSVSPNEPSNSLKTNETAPARLEGRMGLSRVCREPRTGGPNPQIALLSVTAAVTANVSKAKMWTARGTE